MKKINILENLILESLEKEKYSGPFRMIANDCK
jgi:hypothetical protein